MHKHTQRRKQPFVRVHGMRARTCAGAGNTINSGPCEVGLEPRVGLSRNGGTQPRQLQSKRRALPWRTVKHVGAAIQIHAESWYSAAKRKRTARCCGEQVPTELNVVRGPRGPEPLARGYAVVGQVGAVELQLPGAGLVNHEGAGGVRPRRNALPDSRKTRRPPQLMVSVAASPCAQAAPCMGGGGGGATHGAPAVPRRSSW